MCPAILRSFQFYEIPPPKYTELQTIKLATTALTDQHPQVYELILMILKLHGMFKTSTLDLKKLI